MAQTALGYAAQYRAQAPTKRRLPKTKEIGQNNLTTSEVAKLTGASLRQLQWWDEQRLVTVRHSGHSRIYEPEDVRRVQSVVLLRRRGISLQVCRRLIKQETGTVEAICEALDVLKRYNIRVA